MSLILDVIRELNDTHNDHDHHDEHGHSDPSNHTDEASHDDHGHDDDGDESGFCSGSSCLRNWKIGFATLLFVEGVIFGYFALVLKRFACLSTKRFRKTLSFVNIGGGGIFLASGFLHIMPEALEFLAPSEEGHDDHGEGGHDDHGDDGHDDHGGDSHDEHNHGGFPTALGILLLTYLLFMGLDMFVFPHSHGDGHGHGDEDEALKDAEDSEEKEEEEDGSERQGLRTNAFLSMSLMTFTIAIHSIFESIALGASSRWSSTLNLFLAIATHRWATTMALGARYERVKLSFVGYTILVFAFAAVAPISIAIGAAVRGNASTTAIGVVFAISAGIFFYVGGFETPVEELIGKQENKLLKYLVYVGGAGIIAIITVILSVTGVH